VKAAVVGGRVWSQELANGAIVERGAEFLLPGNTAVRELAESYGLGFWDKGMRYGQRDPRGADTSTEALAATADIVGRALRRSDPDVSARAFLAELDIGPGEREALIARVEISSSPPVGTSLAGRWPSSTSTGCFAGSDGALERLDVRSGPQRWLESLAALRPDLELDPAGAVLSNWAADPWVRGAYSTSPAIALASVSERPVGRLAFAGEHLGGEFAALMEGAIRSGRQAARALLAAVRTAP
jgi:hypothetical protein